MTGSRAGLRSFARNRPKNAVKADVTSSMKYIFSRKFPSGSSPSISERCRGDLSPLTTRRKLSRDEKCHFRRAHMKPLVGSQSYFGNRKTATDFLCQSVGDFGVAGNCLGMAGCRVAPQGMGSAFPFEDASIPPQMSQQGLALHPTVTTSCRTSGGIPRRVSSRRSSRIKLDSLTHISRHSSPLHLAIGSGDLRTVGDPPLTVPFQDGGKLISLVIFPLYLLLKPPPKIAPSKEPNLCQSLSFSFRCILILRCFSGLFQQCAG